MCPVAWDSKKSQTSGPDSVAAARGGLGFADGILRVGIAQIRIGRIAHLQQQAHHFGAVLNGDGAVFDVTLHQTVGVQLNAVMSVNIACNFACNHHTVRHDIPLHFAGFTDHNSDQPLFGGLDIPNYFAIDTDTFKHGQTALNDGIFADECVELFRHRLEGGAFILGKLAEHE